MNIIVTGASRGIGFQLALEFCKESSNRVLVISRNISGLEELRLKKEKTGLPGELIIMAFDLNECNEQKEELLKKIQNHFNHAHILVNNAGKLINKPFYEFSPEEAKSLFDVNFFSPASLIQILRPIFGGKEHTHILNISSMGGYQGSAKFPGLSFYSASKAALAVLTECLAEEFRDENLFVNCLALGAVQTEMLEEAFPGYKAPVSAEEMAKWIADFSLNGHRYFNGKILPVSLSTP
jgi:3-oxoacyl-[acyl-carrier protein] reductase